MTHLLELDGLTAGYGGVDIIKGLKLSVNENEIVALLGANGAGKTTTIRAIAGDVPRSRGKILFSGSILNGPLHRRARQGISFIFDDRSLIMGLTAKANLQLAKAPIDDALELFPELETHLDKQVGLLSGGQQQMLSLATCITVRPSLLVIDELSLGLAPLVVDRLLDALLQAAAQGAGVLLVEQHVHKALNAASRCYTMKRGELLGEWTSQELRERPDILENMYVGGMTEELLVLEGAAEAESSRVADGDSYPSVADSYNGRSTQ